MTDAGGLRQHRRARHHAARRHLPRAVLRARRPAGRPGRARRPAAAADGHARPAADRRARRRHLADQQGRRRRRRRSTPTPTSTTCSCSSGVDEADRQRPAELRQHPRRRRPVRRRARPRARGGRRRPACGSAWSTPTASPWPPSRRPTAGSSTAATSPSPACPGTAAPVVLAFTDTEGSATGACCPPGNVRDAVDGIEVTCVDNGMPVVLAHGRVVRAHRLRDARGAGRRRGPARAGRRLPPQGRRS